MCFKYQANVLQILIFMTIFSDELNPCLTCEGSFIFRRPVLNSFVPLKNLVAVHISIYTYGALF